MINDALTLICLRSWLPVLSGDDGQADLTLLVNVWMINLSLKANLRWLKRVLGWECYFNSERALVIWRIFLQQQT